MTKNYGLLAAAPIRWLIKEERDVYAAIQAFLEKKGGDFFDVIGPPSAEQIVKYRENPKKNKLPVSKATLRFKLVTWPLTGEAGVEVTCSPEDMELIESWRTQAQLRKALAAKTPLNMADREFG